MAPTRPPRPRRRFRSTSRDCEGARRRAAAPHPRRWLCPGGLGRRAGCRALLDAARGRSSESRRREGGACGRGVGARACLWRGRPLADVAYADFAQAEVARLEELRLTAVEELIDARIALGRHAETVGELERLVGTHPLRERLRASLLLALYRSGRQAEALDHTRARGQSWSRSLASSQPGRCGSCTKRSLTRTSPRPAGVRPTAS